MRDEDGEAVHNDTLTNEDENEVMISSLTPCTSYSFYVQVQTINGTHFSDETSIVALTEAAGNPEYAERLKILNRFIQFLLLVHVIAITINNDQ